MSFACSHSSSSRPIRPPTGSVSNPDDYYKPLTDYHEATVEGRPIDWAAVARSHGTNYKMLRELNHWIRDYDYDNKAGRSFVIKVPNRDFRRAR